MGTVADAALAAGGEVVGVIPEALAGKEAANTGLTRLHIDVEGYFAPLLAFVDRAVGDGFIRPPYRGLF